MNSKQRVLSALKGDDVDRPPVSNPTSVATVELMDYVAVSYTHLTLPTNREV